MNPGLLFCRLFQCIGNPFVETDAVLCGFHGQAQMNFRFYSHIKCAGKRFFRGFSCLSAQIEVIFNRVSHGLFQFINGSALKSNNIPEMKYIAMKNIGIRIIFETALVPFVTDNIHGLTPICSKKRLTDFKAPLSVFGCGWGRWKVATFLPKINQTREPLPSLIVPPEALNSSSISAHLMSDLTGLAKIAPSVLRCLLFI